MAPDAWVGLSRAKRGDSLHSRARRVVASAPDGLTVIAEGNFAPLGGVGDFMFVRGVVSIKEGVSDNAANPPICQTRGGRGVPVRP